MTDGGKDTGRSGVIVPDSDALTPEVVPPTRRPNWLPAAPSATAPADPVDAAGGRAPAPPGPVPPLPEHRPRIVDDSGILGLSRVSRSRFGARVFTWFFVLVFTLIVVQMIVALMTY